MKDKSEIIKYEEFIYINEWVTFIENNIITRDCMFYSNAMTHTNFFLSHIIYQHLV